MTDYSNVEVLRPKDAARYLGVKETTLAIWRSTGRYNLPYLKVGRYIQYRKTDLNAFLDGCVKTHVG